MHMPRKSKRQKLLSALRFQKKLIQEKNEGNSVPVLQFNPDIQKIQQSIQKTNEKVPDLKSDEEELLITDYFKHDLKKSIFLIAGIIALEIIFYFVTMNTNLKIMSKFF